VSSSTCRTKHRQMGHDRAEASCRWRGARGCLLLLGRTCVLVAIVDVSLRWQLEKLLGVQEASFPRKGKVSVAAAVADGA
jgi:hypothetical protein